MGAEVDVGRDADQHVAAFELREADLAVIGDQDGECAGQAAGAARFGLVLEGDEVVLHPVSPSSGRHDVGGGVDRGDIALQNGQLIGELPASRVDRRQPGVAGQTSDFGRRRRNLPQRLVEAAGRCGDAQS